MASRTSQSPSRIPVPVRSPSQSVNGRLVAREQADSSAFKLGDSNTVACHENGIVNEAFATQAASPQSQKGKGFETFVMTGDMIIRTTPPHQKSRPDGTKSVSPNSVCEDQTIDADGSVSQDQAQTKVASPKPNMHGNTKIVKSPLNTHDLPRAPVATLEELSDASQSSSGSESLVVSLEGKSSISPIEEIASTQESLKTPDQLDGVTVISVNGDHDVDKSFQEGPSSGDSGVLPDSQSSDSDGGERSTSLPDVPNTEDPCLRTVVTSKSAEKITGGSKSGQGLVRTSKSHENYLESGNEFSLVSIDIDDSMAYSLDTLTYHADSSVTSLDKEGEPASKSLQNSPERKTEKTSERVFMPGFISLDEPKPVKGKVKDKQKESDEDSVSDEEQKSAVNSASENPVSPGCSESPGQDLSGTRSILSSKLGVSGPQTGDEILNDADSEILDWESLYHQPLKSVDRPSAARLAKRLYNLDGFRKCDVSRHLSKKNDFSTLVAEEYLKYFDFDGDTLDVALRKFLKQFALSGETQERERVLAHFSHHFMECNQGSFNSDDACHTLTCAIMLLNTDLHGQFVGRKMSCAEFLDNLSELNDGENFPREVLKAIYQAIKAEPLDWAVDEDTHEGEGQQEDLVAGQVMSSVPQHFIGHNPFLDLPDPTKTTEYKKGYVMRKCCMEGDGRKTPLGKRGWKMFCAVLRDMVLFLYKDEHQMKKGHFVEGSNNAIRVHHSLATKASDYTKKQHVFRLQTAECSEYLFQTSDSKELQEWIDTINMVAATLSSPPLPGAVGSKAKFQRPLLPASYTRLNMKDQLSSHEQKVAQLEQEMHQHQTMVPEKGAKSRIIQDYLEKENYLEYELKRFKTYVYLLQGKMTSFPELEPSLVETAIGEDEEIGVVPRTTLPGQGQGQAPTKPVHRSLSDRYSYRAAIYQTDRVEYDII